MEVLTSLSAQSLAHWYWNLKSSGRKQRQTVLFLVVFATDETLWGRSESCSYGFGTVFFTPRLDKTIPLDGVMVL